jgi:hypothetical protein
MFSCTGEVVLVSLKVLKSLNVSKLRLDEALAL